MVRSEDPPGTTKHLRFGNFTQALADTLVGFPGVKSIVLYTHGAKGEHPHFHVWWSGDEITNQTVRNRLKAYDTRFALLKGQNDWSIRNHDSYEKWAAYVQHNKTHKILHGELPPPPVQLPTIMPEPFTPQVIVIRKKPTAAEKLINYCLTEEGFTLNQWTEGMYNNDLIKAKLKGRVAKALVTYSNGRLDDRQMVSMGRHIIYHFSDEGLKEQLEQHFCENAKKFW